MNATEVSVYRPTRGRAQQAAHRAFARGEITRILPGVYGPPGGHESLELRARALQLFDPDAVITKAAAARFTWWADLPVRGITAVRSGWPTPAPGFEWERRTIPEDLIMRFRGIGLTSPALTVLDLIPSLGGNAIDEALRRGAVTLPRLWHALELTPRRPGNALRRALLDDSQDLPWSEAERNLHRDLRAGQYPWPFVTNHPFTLSDGRRVYFDAAILELRLCFEADGYEYHGPRAAFERDHDRDTDLAAQGWGVHRFTAAFLHHRPEDTRSRMTSIIERRARELGL